MDLFTGLLNNSTKSVKKYMRFKSGVGNDELLSSTFLKA